MKTIKWWILFLILAMIPAILVLCSPLIIMIFADDTYYSKSFKENVAAFESVKNDLLFLQDQCNNDGLTLTIQYDENGTRFFAYTLNGTTQSIDASGEDYDKILEAFSDLVWNKVVITPNQICFSAEDNNYAFIYTTNGTSPKYMNTPSSPIDIKTKKVSGNWYYVTSKS